jgi:glutathione S-transferase
MTPRPVAAPLTLVSFDLCPYVQRAAIVLAEKGIPFRRIDIDLATIVEYLEETPGAPLPPADPLVRARHRGWMEFGSSILADIWVLETTADRAAFDAKVAMLREKFRRVEAELGHGPYFMGDRFSIVDAVFTPVFHYFDVLDDLADLGLFAETAKVRDWRRALAARSSVAAAVVSEYPRRLQAFLERHAGIIVRRAAA